jgi:hypothetical protein
MTVQVMTVISSFTFSSIYLLKGNVMNSMNRKEVAKFTVFNSFLTGGSTLATIITDKLIKGEALEAKEIATKTAISVGVGAAIGLVSGLAMLAFDKVNQAKVEAGQELKGQPEPTAPAAE